ncbi:hypothetical protein GCM10011415_42140 [Salipiger pallidus]|uniref:Uncharacterized protein n=1 Tax=Salipiger pallidus TaxID=1775170 RepID=A0A8J2ZPP2_9RHOB|nr:hypothetical protein [Salipiger pallidus]GGG87196.1 hypothetical protein GCM10011415_42140 [Salipiger pallidus]
MQFPGLSQTAPLATGHPQGLPAVNNQPPPVTKVQPVSELAKSGADPQSDPGGQPPNSFWRTLSGMPDPSKHVAPPSMMQIRIARILEEQAKKLTNEADLATSPDSDKKDEAEIKEEMSDTLAQTEKASAQENPLPPIDAEPETDRPMPSKRAETAIQGYGEQARPYLPSSVSSEV